MQPTLVLSAPQPGILYINGRFAGEISNEDPLYRPVSSRGAVYLDYRPLSSACESMARKLVFSGGEPMPRSLESAGNLNVVVWCGGTVEIELTPPETGVPRRFEAGGQMYTLEDSRLHLNGSSICTLPAGAQIPEYRQSGSWDLFCGRHDGGQYLLVLDQNNHAQRGFLQAQQIETEKDGRIRAIVSREDLAGHIMLETWQLTEEGLQLLSSERSWLHGAPRKPGTPSETARAFMDALLAGLDDEADAYLSPALRTHLNRSALREICDLCIPMKYAPPDSRPCVGLLQLQGERLARVRPLYYKASPAAGDQGSWQIDEFEWE